VAGYGMIIMGFHETAYGPADASATRCILLQ